MIFPHYGPTKLVLIIQGFKEVSQSNHYNLYEITVGVVVPSPNPSL